MLEEAVEVIRKLWTGEDVEHDGVYYTVENARIYTLPEEPPPVMVSATGPRSAELAGRIGDGMFGLIPDPKVIEQFEAAGGAGKPKLGQVHVCWAEDEQEAKRTALRWWPNAVASGSLPWELPLPSHFEAATEWADEDAIAEKIVCGPDPQPHLEAIREFIEAGYDHVYFHQVGPDQEGFLRFAERELLPELTAVAA
jgi:G6PDH family F420-dependent oxidoreductase